MLINRIFGFCVSLSLLAAACTPQADWYSEYGELTPTEPAQMYGNMNPYGDGTQMSYAQDMPTQNIAVLLPLSGANAEIGRGIRTSVETAALQQPLNGVTMTFYDMSGPLTDKQTTVASALATNPAIIIGPVFADDVRMVRSMKPMELPVLSFSSDTTAIGGGVMTMALMPTQSIETIIREMGTDGVRNMVILAPDTASGKLMAGTAIQAANIYDMPVAGLFYYTEKDTDSIKNAANRASMFTARTAANTRAREILSDILTREQLTPQEKTSLNAQLGKISKSETLGDAPFDAVLFLGGAADSRALASFLRYYGIGARDARFYGTALWDGSDVMRDFTMSGSKFATLPEIPVQFTDVYEQVAGRAPSRLDSFGYDATNLAVGMIYSDKSQAAYLLDPSGYRGVDGLLRMRPDGTSERALRIVQTNGTDTPRLVRAAATNFMVPLYNIEQRNVTSAREIPLISRGVNPADYIQIPARFAEKYKSKTYGANTATAGTPVARTDAMVVLPEDDRDAVTTPDFQPVALESIQRSFIDSVEIEE
ncbi:MAG: penicillin-binding protein activator [Alphaproteobacteria bacterium]|nr:penicillin-binding protein activator [Alphaproteobacteria bacterium]